MMPSPKKHFSLEKWIQLLRDGKSVYSLAELQRLTGLSPTSLRRALLRLGKRNLMLRIGKGLYANGLHPPALEEIAGHLYPPAYISLESALFMHGIIDQAPQVLTCVTLNKTKVFQTALGEIFYAHLKPELFFGYRIQDNLLLAEPEKAALDYIYLQRQNGLHPTLEEWNLEHLDLARLTALVERFPGTVANHISVLLSHAEHKQMAVPGEITGKKMAPRSM